MIDRGSGFCGFFICCGGNELKKPMMSNCKHADHEDEKDKMTMKMKIINDAEIKFVSKLKGF